MQEKPIIKPQFKSIEELRAFILMTEEVKIYSTQSFNKEAIQKPLKETVSQLSFFNK